MQLAVINRSTLFDDAAARVVADVCSAQIERHVAPAWRMTPAPVVFCATERDVPRDADRLTILDDADQAGSIGYHRVDPTGHPYSRVFVRPIYNHAGAPLTGEMSVSASVSHEACEWFVDPWLNFWVDGPNGEWPLEVCDPTQEVSYVLLGVAVSNFVTRRYFDPREPGRRGAERFDHVGHLTKPFSITAGGSTLTRKAGEMKQIFGERWAPWRTDTKTFPASRTFRRRAGHP